MNVADALAVWVRDGLPCGRRPRTVGTHAGIVEDVLVPRFGRVALSDLSPKSIARWQHDMIRDGLALSTVRQRAGTLRLALAWMVTAGMLAESPANYVRMPRRVKQVTPAGVVSLAEWRRRRVVCCRIHGYILPERRA
jgi:hypothetical protein